jgi:hypothetical protein
MIKQYKRIRATELTAGIPGSMSLLFHNIRSAKGGNLELLEAELRMWAVRWDVVGLAETWLDAESEKRVGLEGYVCLAEG